MASVANLYRYPVKGFTPEPREELVIQDNGRVQGDRVLAFRFADAATPEQQDGLDYWPKSKGLALMDFPSLARLTVSLDDGVLRFTEGGTLIVEAGLDPAGRRELSDRIADWVLAGPDAKRLQRPGRLPLELVGDGDTSRFQDRPRGFVSLHGTGSVDAVAQAVHVRQNVTVPVDSRRFRSNIVVDGLPAWEELGWVDASDPSVQVGDIDFTVRKPIVRCMAITANPDTGERDANLLKILTREFDQAEPTLGVLLLPTGAGGTIRRGDPVGR